MKAAWIVGIDIRGTFTDVVAVNASNGEARTAKVRSRPAGPLQSVESAFEAVAVGWPDVSNLIYGTTMATNAIVEGNLAPVALVATEGFRDTIERQVQHTLLLVGVETEFDQVEVSLASCYLGLEVLATADLLFAPV